MKNEINYLLMAAGILMIASSSLNYYMNEDFVSLGIFVFAGLGFIKLSVKSPESKNENKIDKYAVVLFSVSIVFFAYWLLKGKMGIL